MLVVFLVFIAIFILSRLLFVPTVLGAFKIKQMLHKMNPEKWSIYLSNLSVKEYVVRVVVLLGIPVVVCCVAGYFLFQKKYSKKEAIWLAIGAFVLNVSHMTYKMVSHREELLEMIQNIKNTDSEND